MRKVCKAVRGPLLVDEADARSEAERRSSLKKRTKPLLADPTSQDTAERWTTSTLTNKTGVYELPSAPQTTHIPEAIAAETRRSANDKERQYAIREVGYRNAMGEIWKDSAGESNGSSSSSNSVERLQVAFADLLHEFSKCRKAYFRIQDERMAIRLIADEKDARAECQQVELDNLKEQLKRAEGDRDRLRPAVAAREKALRIKDVDFAGYVRVTELAAEVDELKASKADADELRGKNDALQQAAKTRDKKGGGLKADLDRWPPSHEHEMQRQAEVHESACAQLKDNLSKQLSSERQKYERESANAKEESSMLQAHCETEKEHWEKLLEDELASRDLQIDFRLSKMTASHKAELDAFMVRTEKTKTAVDQLSKQVAALMDMLEESEDRGPDASTWGAYNEEDLAVTQNCLPHVSRLSHGVEPPHYDAATGKHIDVVTDRKVEALMDHLAVRDAERKAKDTEIPITIVRTAADIRKLFQDMIQCM